MQCPQCKAEMIAEPLPEKDKIVSAMVERGSHVAYADHKAGQMKNKEADLGVVNVCPNCRYVTRAKADKPGGKAKAA